MNEVIFFVWELFRCIQRVWILNCLSILDWGPNMGGVLLTAHQNVLKSVQSLAHIFWLWQCDGSVHILPIHIYSNIDCHFHIDCNEIFYSGCIKNMVEILHQEKLNTKSSTTSLKMVFQLSWTYRPGVCYTGWYPNGSICFTNSWLAMIPACLIPYMPFLMRL